MSTENGNGDLKLMGEYDFKTPINATVIFCDDEEESTPIVEKEPNSNNVKNNLDDLVSGIIQDINKITKQGNQGTSANISTTSASENHSCVCRSGRSVEMADTVKKDNTTFQTKASSQEQAGHNQTLTKDTRSTNIKQTATNSQSDPPVCLQQSVYPSNQDDTSQTVNKCVQALLDTVSTHLVLILKAFEEYQHIIIKTSDASALEKAWKRFFDIKYRFYYLSFSTVSNIMIPKENDKVFLENFIENTAKLAKTRHIHCNPSETSLLCFEMFRWVKSRMKSPVLADMLQNNREYAAVDRYTNSFQEQQSCLANSVGNTCLFRSGPAGRELTISVSQTIVNNTQSTTQQYNQNHNPSIQNIMPSPALGNKTAYNTQANKSYCSYKQTPTHPYKSAPRPNRNKAAGYQIQHETYHQYNYQNPAPQTRQPPPPPYCLPQNDQQSVLSTVINRQNYTETPVTNQGIYHSYQREEQLEVNRSLSRDSGFMSPLSSASNEPTCSPSYEFDPSASATPLITHVTSLNPNVAFISDGSCHVCGKLTKQKCLGCYKCYYCSHQCQGHNKHAVYQDISIERKPFVWRTLQEHNDTNENVRCRNSVQGKLLLVDDRGYVCQRMDKQKNGCCDTEADFTERYSCDTCLDNNCCLIYEYCVSCCLDPAKRNMLQLVLSKLSKEKQVLFRSLSDDYELCLTKCRTGSQSVLHENSYKNPTAKHCFGDEPPLEKPD